MLLFDVCEESRVTEIGFAAGTFVVSFAFVLFDTALELRGWDR